MTLDEDNRMHYWDADTGCELTSIRNIEAPVSRDLTDGRRFVLGSADNTVKLRDATTGRVLLTLTGHTAVVNDVAFSPDETRLVSASDDATLRLWDATTGRELRVLTGHTAAVNCVAFSPDGTRIVSTGNDKTIRLWDATENEFRLAAKHTVTVRCAAFSPDGTRVVSSGRDKVVKIWDVATGLVLRNLVGHESIVKDAVFSPDGSRVLTSSDDKSVRLWDATTGRELFVLTGHTATVNCAVFSHDSTRIVSSSRDNTVRLWDSASGRQLRVLVGHADSVDCATFSPDGTLVASASDDNTIKLWDAGGKELFTLNGHTSSVNTVTFSIDSKLVVSASNDKTIKLWDVATGKELGSFGGHKSEVASAMYSQDGARLLTSCRNGTAKLWDRMTGQELLNFDYGNSKFDIQLVIYNQNGRSIVGFDMDENIISLHIALLSPDCEVARGSGRVLTDFSITKDGHRIIGRTKTGIEDARILVDVSLFALLQFDDLPQIRATPVSPVAPITRALEQQATPTQGSTSAVSVNNDAGVNVVNNDIGETQVWSLTTGQPIQSEPIPAGLTFVTRADLPDGKRIAFIEGGKIVVRDKAKYAAYQAEMARRLAEYAKPKPEWHAKSFDEAVAAKNWFAARFHLNRLRTIQGRGDHEVFRRAFRLHLSDDSKPVATK
jgi:WD40 repeat protein